MHILFSMAMLVNASAEASGQNRRNGPDVSTTFKGTLALPVPFGNPLFADVTETLGQLDGVLQMPVLKGLGVGAGAKMTWFGINERALAPDLTSGDIRRVTYFGKVQYEAYTTERTYYELSAKLGSSTYVYDCPTCPASSRETALHWGLGAALYVHATDNLSFGFMIGFETDNARFQASDLGLENFPGRKDVEDPRNYRNLLFGMGFSTRLRRSPDGPPSW